MTLARRLNGQLGLLLGCLLLMAAGAVWGVRGLRQDFSVAIDGYERLRQLYQVGFQLQSARAALTADFPDESRARLEVRRAAQLVAEGNSAEPGTSPATLAPPLTPAAVTMYGRRPSVNALD